MNIPMRFKAMNEVVCVEILSVFDKTVPNHYDLNIIDTMISDRTGEQ